MMILAIAKLSTLLLAFTTLAHAQITHPSPPISAATTVSLPGSILSLTSMTTLSSSLISTPSLPGSILSLTSTTATTSLSVPITVSSTLASQTIPTASVPANLPPPITSSMSNNPATPTLPANSSGAGTGTGNRATENGKGMKNIGMITTGFVLACLEMI